MFDRFVVNFLANTPILTLFNYRPRTWFLTNCLLPVNFDYNDDSISQVVPHPIPPSHTHTQAHTTGMELVLGRSKETVTLDFGALITKAKFSRYALVDKSDPICAIACQLVLSVIDFLWAAVAVRLHSCQ